MMFVSPIHRTGAETCPRQGLKSNAVHTVKV